MTLPDSPAIPLSPRMEALISRFRAGERTALARAISIVEDQRPGFQALLHHLLSEGPKGRRIGLTGPPGAGKSTLTGALAFAERAEGKEVGIVAVDPTSPYSGGALLGDRIRMNELATDPGIFIRSMATRGSLGGLGTATKEVYDLMDAYGFPTLLLETVGVGQTELDVTDAADTVVVVLVPESGDGIQAMKAGLMEIADIFVVNKSDRPGAERLVRELRNALHLRGGDVGRHLPAHHGVDLSRLGKGASRKAREERKEGLAQGDFWEIPVLSTVAQTGEGVAELRETIALHRSYLRKSGLLEERRLARTRARIGEVVVRSLRTIATRHLEGSTQVAEGLAAIEGGDDTPYWIAERLLAEIVRPREEA